MSDELQLSHTAGTTDVPLLEQTIGDNLDATVARFARPRGARRRAARASGGRTPSCGPRSTGSRAPCSAAGVGKGDRVGHLGAELRRVDARPSTRPPRSARSWSTSTPPTAPTSSSTCSTRPGSGCSSAASAFKSSQLRRDGRGGPRRVPGAASRSCSSAQGSWDDLLARAERGQPASALAQMQAGPRSPTTRSTSSTPRAPRASPRARPSATATSSTTATSSASCAATPRQDRVCIPVPFYHCFGMVMGNLACTTHGACMVIPAPGFDPAATLAGDAGRDGAPRSTACRRCSSPSGRCRTSRDYDLSTRAHRHHGRLPVPRRDDDEAHRGRHRGDDDLLRHDRDLPGVDADPHRRLLRAQGRHRRRGAPAPRDQGRRPADRRDAAARARRASSAPRATR